MKRWLLGSIIILVTFVSMLLITPIWQWQQSSKSAIEVKPQPPAAIPQPPVAPAVTFEVRGHYHIHPDGTVTDTRNGLMWKRCAEGQTWTGATCSRTLTQETTGRPWDKVMSISWFFSPKQKSWPAFAGYSDWRVPNIKELRTLVYCSSGKPQTWNDAGNWCKGNYEQPTIDQVVFPNVPRAGLGSWFWSASAYGSDSSGAWALYVNNGGDYWRGRSSARQVRLVRAGRVQ
ncbi:hypothetical protein TI04_09475 [Achromatium sp. WMS2]|nr:hypothetical protein TI04_09475 [Achromatium sp. WMS2]